MEHAHIAKFMGPTWGPPGSCRSQMGHMLAPWTLLSGWRSWRENCTLFLWRWWEMSGSWGRAGAHWICPMWHGILWWKLVHNCHQRISRRMAPTQTSFYPRWPLSLVCHLLVWDVQYTVYTWSWNQTSEGRIYHCISCGPNWNNHNIKWSLCRRHWDIRHRGLCRTSETHRAPDLGFVHADRKSLSFFVSLPEDLAVPLVIPRWWPGHLHTGFPGDILYMYKTLGIF